MSDRNTITLDRRLLDENHFEHGLFVVTALLMGLGVVMVYSTTVHRSLTFTGETRFLLRHIAHAGLAILVMLTAIFTPIAWIRRFAVPLLLTGAILMLAVLVWGHTANRSTRWIEIGMRFQPGEFAKLFFVLWLSHSLAKKGEKIKNLSIGFLPYIFVAVMFILLYLLQPDFGSCIFLTMLMLSLLIVAGSKWQYVISFIALAVPVGIGLVITSETKMNRIRAFLDPELHEQTWGYQLNQALTGLASNGLLGAGLGNGRQSISGHLPESQTDFIFSVVGEELGFAGVALIAGCFLYILYRGSVIAWRARDPFLRYLAFGTTLLITLQAGINMAVNCRILPTKGLPLGLISYGGSNMITMAAAIGILLNISRNLLSPEALRARAAAKAPEHAESTEVLVLERDER
ncbi:MAG: cell division protein FtsW [Deltaproteobacteria bacterium]|nr:cell division protein FtsW [Deltaproteobacteria bacterium]